MAAQKLSLKLEDENVKFVYEFFFAVTRNSAKELEFLNQWEMISGMLLMQQCQAGFYTLA